MLSSTTIFVHIGFVPLDSARWTLMLVIKSKSMTNLMQSSSNFSNIRPTKIHGLSECSFIFFAISSYIRITTFALYKSYSNLGLIRVLSLLEIQVQSCASPNLKSSHHRLLFGFQCVDITSRSCFWHKIIFQCVARFPNFGIIFMLGINKFFARNSSCSRFAMRHVFSVNAFSLFLCWES